MKTKPLTFLLALTFLFLFSCSDSGDDFQDGLDAYQKQDYKTAHRLWLPLAEQGVADAQLFLGVMYYKGRGVPQDSKEAVKWFRLAAEQGDARAQSNLDLLGERTTVSDREPSQSTIIPILIFLPSACFFSWILTFLLGVFNLFGFAVMGGPGLGMQWIAEKLRVAPESDSKAERFNQIVYALFWAGPIWLITNILYITIHAGAIAFFVGYFIHLYPQSLTTLSILGIIWLWMSIGITGAIVFAIELWVLKYWLGALSIFWSIWGSLG